MYKLLVIGLLLFGAFMVSPNSISATGRESLVATPAVIASGSSVTIAGSNFHKGWTVLVEYIDPNHLTQGAIQLTVGANGTFSDTRPLTTAGTWTVCTVIQHGEPRLGPCVDVVVQ